MNIAIVGATGLVGREILKILGEYGYINGENKIYLYASEKSDGKCVYINKKKLTVKSLKYENLKEKYDFVLFSAGASISKKWAMEFVNRGAVVIDNSSAFRRDKSVPLVVPEINGNKIKDAKIIANPNCSTIGISLPLFAISKKYKIKRVIVSTYQAVSGAGKKGINDLVLKQNNKFYYNIFNNLLPQIDKPLKNKYTLEEDKMIFELRKILNNNSIKISATCVRVPIKNCHSESVFLELGKKPNLKIVKKTLYNQNGVYVVDNLLKNKYPMPIIANGKNDVFIGRIRKDLSCDNAISMFLCFDNLRKGAALNAVQIMNFMAKKN